MAIHLIPQPSFHPFDRQSITHPTISLSPDGSEKFETEMRAAIAMSKEHHKNADFITDFMTHLVAFLIVYVINITVNPSSSVKQSLTWTA